MTVVLTMAGHGSRFAKQGYRVPKHLIGARGQSLLDWSLRSLEAFFDQHFVFACLAEHDADWIRARAQACGIAQVSVVSREGVSSGQAQTAFDALANPCVQVSPDQPLWIFNIDTFVQQGLHPAHLVGAEGCLHVFPSSDPGMSFVRCDDQGAVIEVAEKRVISNWASVGFYGFSSVNLFRALYSRCYAGSRSRAVSGEFYVAPMFEPLLRAGGRVVAPKLQRDWVHILGTPADVLAFDPSAVPPQGCALLGALS